MELFYEKNYIVFKKEKMKKVLIITYYWVPSGGSGVQRWVKFTKYLRDFGWEPIIYTPQNPEYPAIDNSFEKDIPQDISVMKTPIWEPYNVYRKLTGKKGESINAGFISEGKAKNWKDKLSIWIRGNFLIPDPRCFWIKPSVRFLSKYLKENPVDAIISTGPPHSMHMIALGVKKKIPNLPWIADFRDPWTGIYFYKDLQLTKFADYIHRQQEKKIITSADSVIVVSKKMEDDFNALSPKNICIIRNGFDEDDFQTSKPSLDSKFSISYIGLLTTKQNPVVLWKVLRELCDEKEYFRADLAIHLTGKIDFSALDSIEENDLEQYLTVGGYVPHVEAIKRQQSSQLLLLLLTKDDYGILTGKFFEYLAAQRPILGVGSTICEVANILRETNAGKMVDFDDETAIRETILTFYEQYKNGTLHVNSNSVTQYSRRNLTKQLAELLDEMIFTS